MICPFCRHFNDPELTPSGRNPPKDWDPVCCIGCRKILCIDHTSPGELRSPTADDWLAWHRDRRFARILSAYPQPLRALDA